MSDCWAWCAAPLCVPGKSLMEKSGRNAVGLSRHQRNADRKECKRFLPHPHKM